MKQDVIDIVDKALEALGKEWGAGDLPPAEVEFPRDESMGDFATTIAMRLTKLLKKPLRLDQVANKTYKTTR